MLYYSVFETRWGWVGVAGSERGLLRLILPQSTPEAVLKELASLFPLARQNESFFAELTYLLRLYFEGRRVEFPGQFDLSQATPFQRAVWEETCSIPYGETRSYSWVAERLGRPKAQRAVGQALKHNPLPILIPCHRVIGSDGSLVGFGGGLELKRRLLELEASKR